MSLRYFTQSKQAWKHDAVSATPVRAAFMTKKAKCADYISNPEYRYTIAKIFHDERVVKKCVLKCGVAIVGILNALDTVLLRVAEMSSCWFARVCTAVMRANKSTRVEDDLCPKLIQQMVVAEIFTLLL